MGIQLRAYDQNGVVLGFLPDFTDLKEQQAHNDVGALTFRYPLDGVNASWLGRDTLYLSKLEDGVEGIDRYLYEDDSDDDADVQGDGRLLSVAARSTLAMLEQAVVYPKGHTAGGSVDGLVAEYDFTGATPGTILKTFIDKAKARGCFPNLTYDFTATTDSAGQAWVKTHTVKYTAGMSLLQVVAAMCDNGWADVRAEGFKIRLYNPDAAVGADKPGVILRLGQQVTSGPRKRTRRGILSHMLGAGSTEKNTNVELSNATTLSRYGRREGFASDGRITDYTELTEMTSYQLKQRESMREGFTLSVALEPTRDEVWPIPGKDFKVGERIRYDRRRLSATEFEPLRVRTMSWDYGNGKSAPSCSIELNDMFVEAGIRLARRLAGIVNGSTTTAPPPPTATPKDTTVPKQPASITLDPITTLVDGKYVGSCTVTWPGVTLNTNDTPIDDFAHYRVSYRVNGGMWTAAKVSDDTTEWISGLTPLSSLEVRVAAADTNGHVSTWMTSAPVTIPLDDVPPPKPSTPILTTRLGTVTCRWDGKDDVGGTMPADFDYVEVHSSTDSGFATYSVVDRLYQPNAAVVVTGQTYGTTVFYRLVAADKAGNRSAFSASASIATAQTFNSDLAQEVVNKIDQAEINAKSYADTTYSGTKSTVNSWTFSGKTTINGGQIEADTVSAVALKAHIIGADQLVVGGVMNQVPNGTGEWGTFGGLFPNPTTGLSFETVDKPAEVSGVVKCAAGTFTKVAASNFWDVEPGSEFLVEIWLKADLPDSRIYVELRDQDGNHAATYAAVSGTTWGGGAGSTYPIENVVVPTVWTKYTAVAKANATTRKMKVGSVYFNHSNGTQRSAVQSIAIRVRGRGTGLLLVDGTIMAKHMAANSVKADAIEAGAIKAEHLQFGVLRTNLIADPSFEEGYPITERVTGTATNHFQWRWFNNANTSVTRQRGKARSGSWGLDLYCGVAGANARAYSPSFQVTSGKTYKLRVPVVSVGVQAVLDVQVYYGTSVETISTNNPLTLDVIEPLASVPQAAAIPVKPDEFGIYVAEFTPAADQWCMVRISNAAPAGQSSLCVDDVSVVEVGSGGASEFTAAGLRLFDNNGDEVGAFVTNRPNYFSIGDELAKINEKGEAAFSGLTVNDTDMLLAGDPLLGLHGRSTDIELTPANDDPARNYETDPLGILERRSLGVVAQCNFASTSFPGTVANGGQIGLFQLDATMEPGRTYQFSLSSFFMNAAGAGTVGVIVRYTTDGTTPDLSSSVLYWSYERTPASGLCTIQGAPKNIYAATSRGLNLKILVCAYASGTTATFYTGSGDIITASVSDMGPTVANTGTIRNITSGTPAATVSTYTKTYGSTGWASYGLNSGSTYGVRNPNTGYAYHGYYSGNQGNQFSKFTFNHGLNLANVTIKKAELYVTCKGAYYNSGISAAYIRSGTTGLTASPMTSTAKTYAWSVGSGKYVDITSIFAKSHNTIQLGQAGSTSLSYYGYFAASATLRITYTA